MVLCHPGGDTSSLLTPCWGHGGCHPSGGRGHPGGDVGLSPHSVGLGGLLWHLGTLLGTRVTSGYSPWRPLWQLGTRCGILVCLCHCAGGGTFCRHPAAVLSPLPRPPWVTVTRCGGGDGVTAGWGRGVGCQRGDGDSRCVSLCGDGEAVGGGDMKPLGGGAQEGHPADGGRATRAALSPLH